MSFWSPELPDPDAAAGRDVIIFDGRCVFCRGQVRNLRRLDVGGKLSFVSLHDSRVADRYPELTYDRMMEQMFAVTPDGQYFGGSDAVRYLSRRLCLLWPVMPILHLPGTAGLWRWLYQLVAKHRYRIAGKACQDDACSIHHGR